MKQSKVDKVTKAFYKLLKKSPNNVTTLDVKANLRHEYPSKKWKQSDISQTLIDLDNIDNSISYKDNGTFREYYMIQTPTKITKLRKAKIIAFRDGGKISKTNAVNKMKSSKGRFFTVTFIKQDKTKRTLNGNVRLDNFMNAQGYINVTESNGNSRQINPRTITNLKIAGSEYTVK